VRRVSIITAAVAIVMLAASASAYAGGYTAIDSWGSYGTGAGQLAQPKGIAVDRYGFVYVCDYANDCIDKFTADGTFVDTWGRHGTALGLFRYPSRIAIAGDDTLYVTDALNSRVQRFSLAGDLLGAWGHYGTGKGEFDRPRGVAVGPNGLVCVTDEQNNRVEVFTASGRFVRMWGSRGSEPGQFKVPKDIAVAPNGRVIVVDAYNQRIQVFTATGDFVTALSGHGLAAGRFAWPRGVEVDAFGNIFVCDTMNARVQEFAADYSFVRAWGCFGSLLGLFDEPRDLAVAPDGTLFVVDTYNHRVQRFALSADLDNEPPVTTSDAPGTWSRAPVSVTLTATDTGGSGVSATYARIGRSAPFALASGALVASRQGVSALQYLSVDAAGNQELVRSRWLRLDWTRPTVTSARPIDAHVRRGDTLPLTVTVADNVARTCLLTVHVYRDGTLVDSVAYGPRTVTPRGRTYTLRYTCALTPGSYLVRIFAKDQAGNAAYCRGRLSVR
jgi:DNA-binding beta-propeller fold protein YncE